MPIRNDKLTAWLAQFPADTLIEIRDLESIETESGEVCQVHCNVRPEAKEG